MGSTPIAGRFISWNIPRKMNDLRAPPFIEIPVWIPTSVNQSRPTNASPSPPSALHAWNMWHHLQKWLKLGKILVTLDYYFDSLVVIHSWTHILTIVNAHQIHTTHGTNCPSPPGTITTGTGTTGTMTGRPAGYGGGQNHGAKLVADVSIYWFSRGCPLTNQTQTWMMVEKHMEIKLRWWTPPSQKSILLCSTVYCG